MKIHCIPFLISALLFTASASAQTLQLRDVVSFDANDSTGFVVDATYNGFGVLGDGSDINWNSSNIPNTSITNLFSADNTGNTTPVSFTSSGFTAGSGFSFTPAQNPNMPSENGDGATYTWAVLIGDYNIVNNTTATLSIAGLPGTFNYDLVVFAHGDANDQSATVTVRSDSKTTATWTGLHDLTEGVDYVRFNNIAPGLGGDAADEISFTVANLGSNFSGFNGFQIQAVAIPEPSSLMLVLGSVAAGLVLKRRRR